MSAPMYLRCLGQPALFSPSGDLVRFRTRKHLALLVFLVVESRRPHRRDQLADLLWSHAQPHEARHSLATALSVIRSRIGSTTLQTTRESVYLPPGRVETDIDRLLSGNILPNQMTVGLEVESFLDGFDISGSPEFALWKDAQQARLLPALKDALLLQLGWSRRTGDSRSMEETADRMLALDELSEDAVRAKMEARAMAGDRLTALRLFEDWKARLSQELQATPSDLVEGMAVRLRRRGWERTTSPEIPTVRTDQWRDRPFVGRQKEYQVLYDAWELARRGQQVQVLVQGDSGVGKTTLIDRIATASALEGAIVSRTQCYDLDRELPYAALGTLIYGLLDSPGLSGAPPESLAELARTVPDIRRRFPSIPLATTSQGETARIRLAESLYDMLQAISEEHPIILIVDDVHQADDASLAVLQLAMRRSQALRILLVVAARLGDARTEQQRDAFAHGGLPFRSIIVEVLPLSPEDSRALLEGLAPLLRLTPSVSVQQRIVRAAAGIPMALELLFQDWAANGDRSMGLSIDAMTEDLAGSAAPPTFYADILARLARALPVSTRSVLNLAAVLGHRLNDVSLYGVVDLSIGGTMVAMTELVSRRVLRDSGKGLEFVNEMIRAAAYLEIPSSLRSRLHSSIADQLIAKEHEGTEGLGLEIAWHCIRAGRAREGTPYLMQGAKEALRIGAAHEAERALGSAISSLTGQALYDASLLLAEVLHERGRSREALDLLSANVLPVAGHSADRAIALAALAKQCLGIHTSETLYDELPHLEEIVVSVASEPSTKAMAGRAMAYIVSERRDASLASQILKILEPIRHEMLDADTFGQLVLSKALLLYNTGSLSDARALVARGVEELESRRAANLVMVQLRAGLGTLASGSGLYAEALNHYKQAWEIAMRLGNDHQMAMVAGNIALCCGRLGMFVEQLDWVGRAPRTSSLEVTGFKDIQLAYCEASACAWLGKPARSCESIAQIEAHLSDQLPSWMHQGWAFWKADVLSLLGMNSQATLQAAQALAEYNFELLSPAFAGPFARWLSRTAGSDTGRERALALVRGMLEKLGSFDELDQAEILCSWRLLTGSKDAVYLNALRRRLSRLPAHITEHLRRQAFLPTYFEVDVATDPANCGSDDLLIRASSSRDFDQTN